MNFNANYGGRQPGPGRKVKRVSDVNAMGAPAPSSAAPMVPPNPYAAAPTNSFPQQFGAAVPDIDPYGGQQQQPFSYQPPVVVGGNPAAANPQYPGGYAGFNQMPQQQPNMPQQQQMPGGQFAMFQQPIVQDMAMQYGQQLADQGKQLMESQFEKYVPITRLKYYFAVDNKYVINKLRLIFFPFTHSDWSLKYNEDNPVQPRYDINAPDLYIPTMAYITYVVLAGFVLGMQNRFSPEQLGIQASSALAYSIFELIIYSITLYVTNIQTSLKTLDLLAYSGYKFVIIVSTILISILFYRVGYYVSLLYSSLSLCIFLLRALKSKVYNSKANVASPQLQPTYNEYGVPLQQQQSHDYSAGRKRKVYFLFLVAGLQPVLAFWLSMHLIPSSPTTAADGILAASK